MADGRALRGGGAPPARRENTISEPGNAARGEVQGDGVVVVPIDSDNRILLVRQFRHGVRMWMRELPRGSRNEGESPEQCAARELREATGHEVTASWTLGRITSDSAQLPSIPFIVAARVTAGGTAQPERTESIDATYAYTFSELARECATGTILDSFTLCAFARLLPHFDGEVFAYRAGVVVANALR